jgi:D-arabinose 1-dehydrogenase-like Zn-dependent alcohol dehydrogenase
MGGAALIVVTAPNPELIGDLVNGLAPLGKLLILAPVGDVPISSVALIGKGASVHGWPSGHALDTEEAIGFAKVHDVECMVEVSQDVGLYALIDADPFLRSSRLRRRMRL